MSGPFEAAGAAKGATRYSALQMGARQFTGLVTQRSPYRDGAVPYLVGKFYGGSRFDTIWDGTNREISQKLTDRRAPGSFVYNAKTFPAANSWFDWKYIQDTNEIVRVILDGVDGVIYDATAGQKSTLLTKAAGAGPARILGLSTAQLFIGDGVEAKKIIGSTKTWQPNTIYNVGDLIIDPNGNIQKAYSVPLVAGIVGVEQFADGGVKYVRLTFDPQATGLFTLNPVDAVQLAGMSNATWLNGSSLVSVYPFGPYGTQAQGITTVAHADYPDTPDTGSATGRTQTGTGTSGATMPAWATLLRRFTTDGTLIWQCYPGQVQDMGLQTPTIAPITAPLFVSERYWQPAQVFTGTTSPVFTYSVRDPNGNIQVLLLLSPYTYQNGASEPTWNINVGGPTATNADMNGYLNFGKSTSWFADTDYGGTTAQVTNPCCIVDANGNLQAMTAGSIAPGLFPASAALTSGATQPTWSTTPGDITVDGPISWVCLGPGTTLVSGELQYAWSTHSVDGTVSTASPVNAAIVDGILGANNRFGVTLASELRNSGIGNDLQWIDEIWLWRTAQGKPTLIRVARIPLGILPTFDPMWTYDDMLPDTALNAFVAAPVAEAADPPPANFLPMCYALQRLWGIVDNKVVWSAGPDAVTGNGLTQFPPINSITFLGKPYAIFPITVQDGGQVVFTSSGIWIILGSGTAGDPFYARPYFQSVNVNGYNAVTLYNQQFFVIESNLKVSSVAVEFPFQPATGYIEVGFPIGDQFEKVTTGGFNGSLFNSAKAFTTWNNQSTKESALYVSDGAGHWFRMNALQAPEQGLVWSPIRTLANGASAVQSVETSPGVNQLLIAPRAGTTGPILARDDSKTVWDDNGTSYPAWDAKGVTLLCTTGQSSTIKHVSAKSTNTGGPRPTVSVLFGEIEPSAERPYIDLQLVGKGNDPPRNRESLSAYSDRYRLMQQGEDTSGDCILVKFDYGTQALGDELLDWGIYGGVSDEDEEQVAKA